MKKIGIWAIVIIFPFLVVGLCFLIIFAFAFGSDALSKEEIFRVVSNNQDILIQTLSDAKDLEYELSGELKSKGIKKIWVCEEEGAWLPHTDFFCGGRGMDDYYGFYYVDNDVPIRFDGKNHDLIEKGNGWRDKYEDYYTERIRENWFYYEMHY